MIRPMPGVRFDQGPVRIKVTTGKDGALFTVSRGDFNRAQRTQLQVPSKLGAVGAVSYWLYRGTLYAEDERLTAAGLASKLEQQAQDLEARRASSRAELLRNARPPGPPRS